MKKLLAILCALLVLPVVLATDTNTGIGIDFETEDFAPLIWMCDHRAVIDDPIQPGRIEEANEIANLCNKKIKVVMINNFMVLIFC